MTTIDTFHGVNGSSEFLGLRRNRQGEVEIVYDDGHGRRMVWRVLGGVAEEPLREVLQTAAIEARVLPALFAELNRRAIVVEVVVR